MPAEIQDTVDANNQEVTVTADLLKEYVAGGRYNWYSDLIQSLPPSIDELTDDFGDDLYDRMMLDAEVEAGINTLKTRVLEHGIQIAPVDLVARILRLRPNLSRAEVEIDAALDERARELAAWCQDVVDNLETPISDVLWNMLDALYCGNKVAELVWSMGTREEQLDIAAAALSMPVTRTTYKLSRINVKARETTAFVVDSHNNPLGLIVASPELPLSLSVGSLTLAARDLESRVLPLEKFLIFTFRPKDNDPRGTSALRSTYNAWWIKQQMYPEWLKFLAQFATASLIGFTSPDAQSELDEDGATVLTPQQAMLRILVQLRNGSAAAFPHGSEVEKIVSTGEGKAFIEAFDAVDRWIRKSILNQTLATGEGQHQARAASETHKDILDSLVDSIKDSVARMIRRDVLKPLIEYNFGVEALALLPEVKMGQDTQHFADEAGAVADLERSGYIDPSQYQHLDRRLGLPVRPQAAIDQMMQRQLAPTVQQQQGGMIQESGNTTSEG